MTGALSQHWTDLDLVEAVKAYPVLYKRDLDDFRNKDAKSIAWLNIAAKLQEDVIHLQMRYKTLRDKYVRERRSLLAGELSSDQLTAAYYCFDSFLSTYIHHRVVRRDVLKRRAEELIHNEMSAPVTMVVEQSEYLSDDSDSRSDQVNANGSLVQNSKIPRVDIVKNEPEIVASNEEKNTSTSSAVDCLPPTISSTTMMQHSATLSQELSEDDYFCLSVAQLLKRMTAYKRSLAKLKMQEILHAIEFGDDA